MTEVESHQPVQVPPVTDDDDDYYQDDAGLPNTPPLKPMKVTYQPSPTPPLAVPLPPVSPDSSPPGTPDSKGPHKQKVRPSQSDAVLIDFIGNFGHRDIARKAGNEPLASEEEGEDTTMNGTHVEFGEKAEAEMESIEKDGSDIEEAGEEKAAKEGVEKDDLSSVAARAMNVLQRNSPPTPTQTTPATKRTESIPDTPSTEDEPMEDVKPTIPSITATLVDAPRLDPPAEVTVKLEIKAPGELPPIRHNSPHSATINGNGGPITLPSISDQLGDISHIPEPVQPGNSPFAQSPPGPRPPPQFAAVQGHGSPPKSPNDFRRELPSPGRGAFYNFGPGSHRRPSQTDGHHYSSAGEYSGSSAETPSTDHSGATPAIDRMSIDGITNPQIGGFQCVYPGCTAQPFQTQYLLNSHANVHSSNRPHYCSVKGCPRSEGGKGFKRKNEMIRHGLVHESPGYVCPFCPDREHKYPRPDNLQRHVRVHHTDKDKDDAQLREVLSQRPEGPNRGRRRRGGTSSS